MTALMLVSFNMINQQTWLYVICCEMIIIINFLISWKYIFMAFFVRVPEVEFMLFFYFVNMILFEKINCPAILKGSLKC